MTREEFKDLAMSRYEKLEAFKAKDNFYDYEKSLADIMQDLTREYLEKSLNETSKMKD
ncbi:MAG: hypothetical protein LBH92_08860 [Bacteroidales bacterium]|nr:hypothetical protein [Bacteroidales bacterium]